MMNYSESTLRKKANRAGYRIEKGFQHWLTQGYPVYVYMNGERETGYNVFDCHNNTYVWGCYNDHVDHLWTLEDVADFLAEVYAENGLTF